MKLFTRDYFLLTKEQNTLSPNYIKTLRKLGATTQQIALTSFLHTNKYWIMVALIALVITKIILKE